MALNIVGKLKTVIDSDVEIALATFAKDADEETAKATSLLVYAGYGMAKCIMEKDGIRWVATEMLNERRALLDISKFDNLKSEPAAKPALTGSLQVRMEQLLDYAKLQTPLKNSENCTFDLVLLTLAGLGLATLVPTENGQEIWAGRPNLFIGDYESILFSKSHNSGLKRTTDLRRQLMDDDLKFHAKMMRKLARAGGHNVGSKRDTDIAVLLTYEYAGNAIAYRNADGRLAWKASPKLLKEFYDPE